MIADNGTRHGRSCRPALVLARDANHCLVAQSPHRLSSDWAQRLARPGSTADDPTMAHRHLTPFLLAACAAAPGSAQDAPPTEFGAIAWQRDFAAAKAASQRTGKPILLLFQEVPG